MNVSTQHSPVVIRIAKDFSETPGPRSRDEGDYSGDVFLDEILLPQFTQAKAENRQLLIDLDGTEGYATSFLESAFGGLARKVGRDEAIRILRFKSEDEPYLVQEIKKYIEEA
jgi:hypothetical protein